MQYTDISEYIIKILYMGRRPRISLKSATVHAKIVVCALDFVGHY